MMVLTRALTSGITVSCKRMGMGHEIPWHDHGRPTVCVVYDGALEEQDARYVRQRTAGDLVFRPVPERHRNRVLASSAALVSVEIERAAMDHLTGLGLPADGPIYGCSPRAARLARLVQNTLGDRDAVSGLELAGLIYELLGTAARQRLELLAGPPPWLVRIRDRLAGDLRETPTLEDLARDAPVSAGLLSRLFRRYFGVSVPEFLRQRRIDRASELLAGTDRPIAEVALASGFYDQSHLTNVFRQYTGFTPAAFRRRSRG